MMPGHRGARGESPIPAVAAPSGNARGPVLPRLGRGLHGIGSRLSRIDRLLPAIFAAYAIPLTIFFGIAIPTFRVPDELWHFARAEQIGAGGLLTWRQNSPGAGGIVDSNLIELDHIISGRRTRDGQSGKPGTGRIDSRMLREAAAIAWGGERGSSISRGSGLTRPSFTRPPSSPSGPGRRFAFRSARP
jgi:hypothetical protein